MLMNLLGQLNAINQYNNAAYSGMQARESQMGLMRGIHFNGGSPQSDTFQHNSMAQLAAKDKQLQLQEIQSNFIMDAMEHWRQSLQEQAKNKKD